MTPQPPQPPSEHDPGICRPCRGTGQVLSLAGDERRSLTCPWCGGSGRRPTAEAGEGGTGGDEPPAAA